jgi:hypothetical protein
MALAITAGILGFFFALWLWFQLRKLRRELAVLFAGKQAKDLETVILEQKKSIEDLDKEIQELYDIGNRLYQLGEESVHKTEVLRFNPFKEVGGNHSFAVAFLNGHNSGFVISSLHTREGTRMYAKPIENGQESKEYPLTEEERETVAAAAKKNTDIFAGTRHSS